MLALAEQDSSGSEEAYAYRGRAARAKAYCHSSSLNAMVALRGL